MLAAWGAEGGRGKMHVLFNSLLFVFLIESICIFLLSVVISGTVHLSLECFPSISLLMPEEEKCFFLALWSVRPHFLPGKTENRRKAGNKKKPSKIATGWSGGIRLQLLNKESTSDLPGML